VGKDCGGGARHPRGGKAELLGPGGGTRDASSKVSREHQAGDLGRRRGSGLEPGGPTSETKYRMPKSQRPDGTVSGSTKRLASRVYQMKAGH